MINVAGNKDCDKYIKEELSIAGIPIIELLNNMNSEVSASIIGHLNGFTFQRAWYYWIIKGYMPLQYANELYEKYNDLNIRVAGNSKDTLPEEWSESKDYKNKTKAIVNKLFAKEITYDEAEQKCEEIRKQGNQFVESYHIDTQEGLLRFAEIIKQYNIIGY